MNPGSEIDDLMSFRTNFHALGYEQSIAKKTRLFLKKDCLFGKKI